MVYEFRLPDIGEGVAEGEVVQWFVKQGDTIQEDAPLVSVLTDKANVEIPSPKAGRIVQLHAAVGDKVKVGGLLVSIETAGESAAAPAGAKSGGAPPAAPATSTAAKKVAGEGRSTPSEAPTETDSAEAPSAAPPTRPAAQPEGEEAPAASPTATATGGRSLASPYLRRLAAERGIDLSSVRGTGPGGRIVEADLQPGPATPTTPASASSERAEGPPASKSHAAKPSAPAAAGGPSVADRAEVLERIPIRGIRRVIFEHMAEATHRAAHFTYVEEVDVTELVRFRDRMAKHVEKDGLRLSYLPFIIKAVIAGLRAYPRVNATINEEQQELVVHSTYNIGIATAAPEGLLVPVLHHAEQRSVTQLARQIQALSEKARAGRLERSEMMGGTFTITSLGALGGILATPILNYPEVAILGVHKIARRPVYRPDGKLAPADLMNISLSLDHRVLDGIIAAQFIGVVKASLEEPHQLFAELA
jgi:pyruvate dehydrogenase E2 component (dihydrolipoamide acetyltransferase)